MALTSEDIDTIARLLDERLAQAQAVDRRRRRFWLWFWIAAFVLSSLASWIVVERVRDRIEAQLAEADRRFLDAKLAYQRQLAQDAEMQRERAAAERAAGYRPEQSQADYEAGLMRNALKAIGKQAALTRKMEQLDPDDPDALLAATEEMSGNVTSLLGVLTQVMLRNTDPAQNTPAERLLAGADGDAPAPDAATVVPVQPPPAR